MERAQLGNWATRTSATFKTSIDIIETCNDDRMSDPFENGRDISICERVCILALRWVPHGLHRLVQLRAWRNRHGCTMSYENAVRSWGPTCPVLPKHWWRIASVGGLSSLDRDPIAKTITLGGNPTGTAAAREPR